MNKVIVACVVLASHAALASAQGQVDPAGDAPGGHGVSLFTEEHDTTPAAAWTTSPRRSEEPSTEFAPGTGAGAFTLGRQYNFEYLTRPDVGDLLHSGSTGKAVNAAYAGGYRPDRNVRYYNSEGPTLSTGASWTVDTIGGDPVADRAWGLSLGVNFGRFSLRAAHQNRHVAQVHLYDLTGATMEAKNSIVAMNLRMGWGTAYAAYSMNRGWGSSPLYNPDNPYGAGVAGTSSTDSRDTLVGVAVPVTRSVTLLASMIHKNDRDPANRDANQFAFGASYVLSHKTDFYAALSHTVNTNGAGVLIGGAARAGGSSAINFGMRHAF